MSGAVSAERNPLPWIVILAATLAATLAAVFAPLAGSAFALALVMAGFLVWRFGARLGSWYLFLMTLPIREPLGWDVVGTKTLYLGDLLLYGLLASVFWERGVREIWRRSAVLKIGAFILFVSVVGLYRSPEPTWELASIVRIFGQVATFYLARHLIRNGEQAALSLVVLLVGMIPAIAYGFIQSSIPVEAGNFPDWAKVPLAYEATGQPRVRIFSTYDHPLHFSQALSMSVGICVGLATLRLSGIARLGLLAVAAAAALCNQYTYSVSGIIGLGTATVAALLFGRSRRFVAVLPLVLVAWFALAPSALAVRLTGLLTGTSTSGLARIITVQQGFRAFLDHPILGVGWGGISQLDEGEYQISRRGELPPAPENYLLYRMVALGIPGIVVYLGLLGLFLRNCRRRPPDPGPGRLPWPRSAVFAAGAAFWVQGMFFPVGSMPNNYVLWMLLAISESMWEAGRQRS